jgi:hypothetical protein
MTQPPPPSETPPDTGAAALPVTATPRSGRLIWLALALHFGLLVALLAGPWFETDKNFTAWLLLTAFSVTFAVVLLVRLGLPRRGQIAAALVLGLLVAVGSPDSAFANVPPTILAAAATFSVTNAYPSQGLNLFRSRSGRGLLVTFGLGLGAAGVLGVVNTLINGAPMDPAVTPGRLLWALAPGVGEEIASRAVFFSFALYLARGRLTTRAQAVAAYALMILPHALSHAPQFAAGSLVGGLVGAFVLAVLFGLPLALLQRRRDLACAMTAHWGVDAIRFVLFGG